MASETSIELLSTGRFGRIKDSSGDWEAFQALLRFKPSVPLLFSLGTRHASLAPPGSADGIVFQAWLAHAELLVGLDRAIARQDHPETARLDAVSMNF